LFCGPFAGAQEWVHVLAKLRTDLCGVEKRKRCGDIGVRIGLVDLKNKEEL